jgi:uncharacterized protein YegJ (DUF2314 family)
VLVACAPGGDGVVERPGEPAVYNVAADDAAMLAASAEARRTVAAFAPRLAAPVPGQSYAAVKVPLRDGEAVEHVWVSDLAYDGRTFRGRLGNTPVELSRRALGDTVRVARDSVSDWMLVARDTVYGAYTVHALRARMSLADRAAFDAEQGVYFPPAPVPIR